MSLVLKNEEGHRTLVSGTAHLGSSKLRFAVSILLVCVGRPYIGIIELCLHPNPAHCRVSNFFS